MSNIFNPYEKSYEGKWLVSEIFRLNALAFFLAQSGVGKSFLIEYLTVCVVYGIDFLGIKTLHGDALILDNDTPTDVLKERLKRMIGNKKTKHTLYYESMEEHTINKELGEYILNKYPTVKLIVIDCLGRMVGNGNPNYARDMNIINDFKRKILGVRDDVAIIIIHHTSDKKIIDLDEFMSYGGYGEYMMGSSVLTQIADALYFITSPQRGNNIEDIYMRLVSKRFQLKKESIKIKLHEDYKNIEFKFNGIYEKTDELKDNILNFLDKSINDWNTIKEIYEGIGLYGINIIREKIRELENDKEVVIAKTRHNLYKIASLKRSKINNGDEKLSFKERVLGIREKDERDLR